jgi:hypothetical protein
MVNNHRFAKPFWLDFYLQMQNLKFVEAFGGKFLFIVIP